MGHSFKNSKILVTSHSRHILNVRVTRYLYSIAMIIYNMQHMLNGLFIRKTNPQEDIALK